MGFSIGHLLMVLLIVVLVFGTKKLRNIGGDLGSAIKNFRQSMRDGETEQSIQAISVPQEGQMSNARVAEKEAVSNKD